MGYKTKAAAKTAFKQIMPQTRGFVYQFPKGHWGYCTVNSPVGQSLQESGMIYPDFKVVAQYYEEVGMKKLA